MIEIDGMKAYTLKEMADILHLSVWTLRKYIKDGRLKARKIGTRYYTTSEEMKAFVKRDE